MSTLPITEFDARLDKQYTDAAEKEIGNQKDTVPIVNAMGNISRILAKYPGSAPGYGSGAAKNIQNPLPPAMQSADQKEFTRNMGIIANQVAEDNWKGRQTPPEIARLRQVMGTMQGQGPAVLRKGLSDMRNAMQSQMAARQGSLQPGAKAKLQANPHALSPDSLNFDFGDQPKAKPASTPSGAPAAPPPGQAVPTPVWKVNKITKRGAWFDQNNKEVPGPNGQ